MTKPRRRPLWQPPQMPLAVLDPYAEPGVNAGGWKGYPGRIQNRGAEAQPIAPIMQQYMDDVFKGMDPNTVKAIAMAAAQRVRQADEELLLKYYRRPYWYGVNIGEFGESGAPVPAGTTEAAGLNRIDYESDSNFEAYNDTRYTRDETTGAINTSNFSTLTFYAGSKGTTSEDPTRGVANPDALLRDNGYGTATRPKRNAYPRIIASGSNMEIQFSNLELANAINAQIAMFGSRVYCGDNPRPIEAKPPFTREPFSFAVTFINAPVDTIRTNSVAFLSNADFELWSITQSGVDGPEGDFEALVKWTGGGKAGLSNIAIRRDAGYGTVERPTILAYPDYFPRAGRLSVEFTNRAFSGAALTTQLCFHGMLLH